MSYTEINMKIKKICSSELLRIIILQIVVLYAYYPFLLGVNLGSNDAYWYHNSLKDAIQQMQHGFFPTYLGQGIFHFFGITVIRAPYYLLLGQFIHLITLGQLSSLHVQHLTVIVSASLAAFCFYFVFNKLNPKLRWASALLSIIFITAPGVIGLIYIHDMYYSFSALPFLPLLFYALIRTYQVNDILAYVLVAAALSLLWMAHPPIAVWCTGLGALFFTIRFLYSPRGLNKLPIVLLILLFCLWQFVAIATLNLGSQYIGDMGPDYVTTVISILTSQFSTVFLPFGWHGISPHLQLGYSFWLLVLLGVYCIIRFKNRLMMGYFLSAFALIAILLYPPPIIGSWLWSLLPSSIRNITTVWPYERFYTILTVLACYIGKLAIDKMSLVPFKHLNIILMTFLVSLCAWNIFQIQFIKTPFRPLQQDRSWADPNQLYFFHQTIQPIHDQLFEGPYDPVLKNRLLDSNFLPLPLYDNEQLLMQECLNHSNSANQEELENLISKKLPITMNFEAGESKMITKFTIKPHKKYLLCMDLISKPLKTNVNQFDLGEAPGLDIRLVGIDFPVQIYKPNTNNLKNYRRTLLVPITSIDETGTELQTQLALSSKGGKIEFLSFGLIDYQKANLPIKIDSFLPYTAEVKTNSSGNYLEIFKEFHPGYEATVNGKKITPLKSPFQLIMIPLTVGNNIVTLQYVGTPLMKIAFYISLLTWLLFLIFIYRHHQNESS